MIQKYAPFCCSQACTLIAIASTSTIKSPWKTLVALDSEGAFSVMFQSCRAAIVSCQMPFGVTWNTKDILYSHVRVSYFLLCHADYILTYKLQQLEIWYTTHKFYTRFIHIRIAVSSDLEKYKYHPAAFCLWIHMWFYFYLYHQV